MIKTISKIYPFYFFKELLRVIFGAGRVGRLVLKEKILSLIDKAAFFFFAVLMFFLPISNAVIESCFGFIFLCFILKCCLKGINSEEIRAFKNKINFLLFLFYIFIGLSLFMSGPLLAKSFRAWVFKWGEGVLLFYFAQLLLKKRDIKFLLIPLFASTFLSCIRGLYQVQFDIFKGLSLASNTLSNGVSSGFNHYNGFASFLTVAFFIILGTLFKIRKFWVKMILGFLDLLVITVILATGSRGAYFSFLVVIFFFGFILYRKKQIRLIYIICIIVSVFILAIFWFAPFTDRLFFSFKTGGDSDRLRIWRISLLIFKDSPIVGKGLGLFMDYLPQYARIDAAYAHNCYLQILAETGIIGLFSFLIFLGTIVTKGLVRIIRDFDELFWGLFSAFMSFLIHSFFDTQLYSLKLSILFWLLASFVTMYLTGPVKHNTASPS